MKLPNYLQKQISQWTSLGKPKGVFHSVISHDDWCNQLNQKGSCNCDPEVLPPMTEVEYKQYLKTK